MLDLGGQLRKPLMFSISQLYKLQGIAQSLDNLNSTWLRELGDLDNSAEGIDKVFEKWMSESRIKLVQVAGDYIDGYRIAEIHTLWFDGEPVAVFRDGGRSGRDFRSRTITNLNQYQNLVRYMRQTLADHLDVEVHEDDIEDATTEMQPEDFLDFGGVDYCAKLGFPKEPRSPGFLLLQDVGSGTIWKHLNNLDLVLIFATEEISEMPEFIRRGKLFVQKFRLMSAEEHAESPDVLEVMGIQYTHRYLYKVCSKPENAQVVKI